MNNICVWPDFIASSISTATPPDVPFVRNDWAGMAFDRNMHEDFSPDDVWSAWLSAVSEDAANVALCAIRCSAYAEGGMPVRIEGGLKGLRSHWMEDGNFMHDHYIFSSQSSWVVRLDQDVTLFAGSVEFLRRVITRLGGVECVEELMRRDLIGDAEDVVGLDHFVKGLLAPLKSSALSE
ncbi:hypothetical protein [Stenotrophomonas tuberculopleuritidis]|uniref:hypothetical protein n=1 Tax=Stenotrophomonas tuberculopleuritidis TaxID=3055079 RepID=UPI0026E50F98|nr:hypothetical protein [Stenotrophomonas sp. 704A1]